MGNAPSFSLRLTIIISALGLLSACSGDDPVADAGNPDSGVADTGTEVDTGVIADSGTPDFSCDDPTFPPFLGPSGSAISGSVIVHIQDGLQQGVGLAGAVVRVTRSGTTWEATTDAAGCVQFDDAALDGPVDVHTFADGRVYISVIGADNDTFSFGPTVPGALPVPPLPATITGNVLGLETLTTTTATIGQVSFVNAVGLDVFTGGLPQAERPGGQGVGQNVSIVGAGFDLSDYTVSVDADRQKGIVVSGGSVQFPGLGTPIVDLTHAGVVLDLDVVSGETLTTDISLTQPLTETANVSFGTGPALAEVNIFSIMFMPNGGVIFFGGGDTGTSASVAVPMVTGDFAGATYGGGAQLTDGANAFSLVIDEGSATPVLDVGDLPDLPTAITGSGRTVSATLDATTLDIVNMNLSNGTNALWFVNILGASTSLSVDLPEVPAGFGDPVTTTTQVSIGSQGLAPGTTIADFGVNGYNSAIRRLASDLADVTF